MVNTDSIIDAFLGDDIHDGGEVVVDATVLVLACLVLGVVLPWVILKLLVGVWGRATYRALMNETGECRKNCDIDAFVGVEKNPVGSAYVSFVHKARLGNRKASTVPIPLELKDSPDMPGLKVSQKRAATDDLTGKKNTSLEDFLKETTKDKKPTVVVATIRMGFGHHRLAYSTVSWARSLGYHTVFHDLLNIDSPEAKLLVSTDDLYSKFSRFSSEMGGIVEKIMGKALLAGDPNALRCAFLTAVQLQPLLLSYPKDTPIISTHQLVTLTAAACGFTNVINLVVDNYAQWFLVVPGDGVLNLVQGPVNYQNFLSMGVSSSPEVLQIAGHWCPHELVTNIPGDCKRRIDRATAGFGSSSKDAIKPRRLLVPVGGAGAQRKFIIRMIRALKDYVKNGRIQLFLNAGDHKHMKTAFEQVLAECDLDYDTVSTLSGVQELANSLVDDPAKEPTKAITLFAFEEYFPAVATTDIMARAVDVLCCKPSELAFYCLPKLSIRRVGDHEAFSAIRSSELGDGSVEAREISDVLTFVDLILSGPQLLAQMNQSVILNNQIGIYDGCKKALELSVERSK